MSIRLYKKDLVFIKDNESVINDQLKIKIIHTIKSRIDDTSDIFSKNISNNGTYINLNALLLKNVDVFKTILLLVTNRVKTLNEPKATKT
jgi:hypothetical protein